MNNVVITYEVTEVTSKCCPVSTGSIESNCWVWRYPAIARVAGTAGNLEKWVTGYKERREAINGSPKTEESFWWDSPVSREAAWEWFEN